MKKYLYEVVDDIDKSKYISLEEVGQIFERTAVNAYLIKHVSEPLILKSEGRYYYLREEIMKWNKFRLECLPITKIIEQYEDQGLAIKGLLAELKGYDIDIVENKNHPFNFGAAIKPEDIEKVHRIVQKKLKIDNAKTCKEKYDILNEEQIIKRNMVNTMEDFNKYAILRFNSKPSDKCLHNPVSQAKVLVNNMFDKDIYLYSEEDIQKRIAMVYNDPRIPKGVKIEFVYFVNYSIKKHKMGINEFSVNQSKLYNKTEKETYSKEQILELFGMIYGCINDRKTLNIALENRGCAVVWLYMFIHYVVFWRTSTIKTIPQPQLELIGFNSGDDFLDWLKEPNNIFTEDMGLIICESVKVQIDSLCIKAKKNNKKLVFEYGKLMSRGLGMLLAICEAHRRVACIKRNSGDKSRADLENIITNSYSDRYYYDKLFGKKIKDILKGRTFGNLPMERAFNNYTLDFTEDNNSSLGLYLLSIMRSHKIDSRGISNVTPIYETRVEEGTIGEIVAMVEEIGSFGFAKNYLMSICDDKYNKKKLSEKHQQLKNLEITPNQAEGLVKTVAKRREEITQLLVKMVLNPDTAKELLKQIVIGENVAGKHNHSKCLLKAFLQIVDKKKEDVFLLNLGKDELIKERCLMPVATKCFSCPLLIGQLFLLNEIGDLINDAVSILENSNNNFEKRLQTTLIFESYLPILYDAQDTFTNEVVAAHINLDNIVERLNLLEEKGKLLFK